MEFDINGPVNRTSGHTMLCRMCLQQSGETMPLFFEDGDSLNIPEIINKHFWFKPLPNDKKSSVICKECWSKIADFHDFYEAVRIAHEGYESKLDIIRYKSEEIDIKQEDEERFAETLLNVETEMLVAPDQRSNSEPNPLDEIEVEKCMAANVGNLSEDEEDKTKPDFSTSDSEYLMPRKKKVKLGKKSSKRKSSSKNVEDTKKPKRTTRKYDPILIESLIKKHIRMVCNLCVFIGETFADIVQHFNSNHPNEKPYVMCCERKLNQRYLLNQHALKHEDPDYFRCHSCQKSFVDSSCLRAHVLCHHATEEEKTHACELCPQRFARKQFLEYHKATHIPREERTFICAKCPTRKAFATDYLLQIHYSIRHKREANVCHVCAKTINDKRCFEKHVRGHFENSGPRLQCPHPGCDSWLKDEDNLKQHLKTHNPDCKTYQCPECGKFCKNRRALTNHKRNAHSTEIFKCEQCDKEFKRAIALKEHMAQHTGETLYKCPFCARTFNSNANMHAHKKKTHPAEWNEWRKLQRGSIQILNQRSETLENNLSNNY
uniref:Transcription factor grauzone n=1 Tax=Glossina pallidipes TaxID=7398 RepID=A0A1B0AF88_GLOPL